MLQSRIGRNFFIVFFLVNAVLIGGFVYAILKRPDLISNMLPGTFGPALSPDLSGNMLFYAILLLVNAALFLLFGLGGTSHGLFDGLRISPRKMRWLLHERVGLANDISGIVAEAVQEEEKAEIHYLGVSRGLLFTGLLLFVASLPALCIAYTHAAPNGAVIFENAGKLVPNGSVSQDTVMRFTADQLAGGLLLGVPEVFHLRATPVETNGANLGLGVLVVLYRVLIGFGLLLWFVAGRRISSLRNFAMEVAMSAADIVAIDPVLQDGHGRHDHGRSDHGDHAPPAPVHEDHGHHNEGRDDHGHDAHADPAPAHEDHGHHEDAHQKHEHHAVEEHADNHHGHGHHPHAQEHAAEAEDAEDDAATEADSDADDEADGDEAGTLPAHDHSAHDIVSDHAAHDAHAHDDHHTHASDSVHQREPETVA